MVSGNAVIAAATSGTNAYTPGSATLWGGIGGCNADGRSTPESNVQVYFGASSTLSKMHAQTSANTGGFTATLRIGGVSQTSTCVLTSGIADGQDLTHSDSVTAGNLISIQCVFFGFSGFCECVDYSFTNSIYAAPVTNSHGTVPSVVRNNTSYSLISGDDGFAATTDGTTNIRFKAVTFTNLSVTLPTNTFNQAQTFNIRKNSITDLNNSVPFAANTPGTSTDITHTDTVVDNDQVYIKSTNVATTGAATIANVSAWQTFITLQTLAGNGLANWAPNQSGNGNFANLGPLGTNEITANAKLQQQVSTPVNFGCTWTNLRFNSVNNSTNNTVTAVGDLNDGTPGLQALVMITGFTGDIEDIMHADTISAQTNLLYKITAPGTTGSFGVATQTSQLNGVAAAGAATGMPNPFLGSWGL